MNQDKILESYLECALWTEDIKEKTIYDVGTSTKTTAKNDIAAFVERSGNLLEGWEDEQIGHDFWLTRNGHGAGFWDRGIEGGDKLTIIAKSFKELNVWVSELGVVYFE